MPSVRLVSPIAEDVPVQFSLAGRLPALQGTRIGMINNSKHMAAEFLETVEALLRKQYGVEHFERYEKLNAAIPSPPEVIQRFVESCDAVIHGVGD
jgi:hypothetical protein